MISQANLCMHFVTEEMSIKSNKLTRIVSLFSFVFDQCFYILCVVIKKGQVMSTYIRFLNRRGGYTWMQMCATLVCNTKNENEQSIICVNYVLSGSQYSHVVMDREQVDQPMVRIKHDTDDASVVDQGHTGSPDSCRGTCRQ